jgi:hypothetical protein
VEEEAAAAAEGPAGLLLDAAAFMVAPARRWAEDAVVARLYASCDERRGCVCVSVRVVMRVQQCGGGDPGCDGAERRR